MKIEFAKYTLFVYTSSGGVNMKTQTVNISFSNKLLKDIDAVSREEARSWSEFIREVASAYIAKKRIWRGIFQTTARQVKKLGLPEKDVSAVVLAHRQNKG